MSKSYTQVAMDDEPRAPYEPEIAFYSTVTAGDVEKTSMLLAEPLSAKQGLGRLSAHVVTNLKYHTIITISMLARRCIEAGLDLRTSYGLSDFYIQQLDSCDNAQEIDEVHNAVAFDYARRMKNLRTQHLRSAPVARSVDYISTGSMHRIHDNIYERITLEGLAEHIGISPAYLSRLFHSETGMTVRDYINKCKVDAAVQMLETSDLAMSDIAYILSFASQSYFTEVFKKQQGMTPTEWRETHIRKRGIR